MENLYYILIAVISYFLGSVPTSYMLVKTFTGEDITKYGSGTSGAINTQRVTKNSRLTSFVLLGDVAKGMLSMAISYYIYTSFKLDYTTSMIIAGAFNVIGNNYSAFIKFKGGKGLFTTAGFLLLINPLLVLIWTVIYFITAAITRLKVLGLIAASITLPIYAYFWDRENFCIVIPICLLISIAHTPEMREKLKAKN